MVGKWINGFSSRGESSCAQMKVVGQLSGHKNIVNSIDVKDGLLCSGSEDKTARLWDMKSLKTISCLVNLKKGGISCVKFGSNDHDLYLGASNMVFKYDLRKLEIIMKDYESITIGDDDNEVNQLCICNDSLYACDDAGILSTIGVERFSHESSVNRHSNVWFHMFYTSRYAILWL